MGEYADMMINGALCEWCGVFVGDEVGYPRKCPKCAAEESAIADAIRCERENDRPRKS